MTLDTSLFPIVIHRQAASSVASGRGDPWEDDMNAVLDRGLPFALVTDANHGALTPEMAKVRAEFSRVQGKRLAALCAGIVQVDGEAEPWATAQSHNQWQRRLLNITKLLGVPVLLAADEAHAVRRAHLFVGQFAQAARDRLDHDSLVQAVCLAERLRSILLGKRFGELAALVTDDFRYVEPGATPLRLDELVKRETEAQAGAPRSEVSMDISDVHWDRSRADAVTVTLAGSFRTLMPYPQGTRVFEGRMRESLHLAQAGGAFKLRCAEVTDIEMTVDGQAAPATALQAMHDI